MSNALIPGSPAYKERMKQLQQQQRLEQSRFEITPSDPPPIKPVTVADLIAHLQTLPQDAPVVYSQYSEQCLLELTDITVGSLCEPRPDGWVQNARPDMPQRTYVLFP